MVEAPVGHHCPTCVDEGRGSTGKVRQMKWGRPGARTTNLTPAVACLIAANVAVFLLDQADHNIQFRFAGQPLLVARGEVYRLMTATFLHANLLHIGMNMFALYLFGPQLETVLGRVRFLAVYLVAALGGSICSFYFGPLSVYSVGASGAVFGLLGAFFVVLRARGADTSQVVGLIVINLFIGVAVPGIDNFAHIGGLLTGGLMAWLFDRLPARGDRSHLAVQAGAVLAVVAVLVVLAALRGRELRARERLTAPAAVPAVAAPARNGAGYRVVGVVEGSQAGRESS